MAFGAYPQITNEQLGRLSLVDFEARRDAFKDYLATVPAKGLALMNNAFWEKSRVGANAKIHFIGAPDSDSFDISLVKYDENWENPELGVLSIHPIRILIEIAYENPELGGSTTIDHRYVYINSGTNGSSIPLNMLSWPSLNMSQIMNINIIEIVELEPISAPVWTLTSVNYPVRTGSMLYNYVQG